MKKIIVAIDRNNAIGKDNKLLWRNKEDLKHFKRLTLHHTVIMGRKTFESIGKALPNRRNVVITRNKAYKAKDCIVVHSLDEAFKMARGNAYIIGGAEIYKQALPYVNEMIVTLINQTFEGADTFFHFDSSEWFWNTIKEFDNAIVLKYQRNKKV